jgi:hypothetical protein
MAIKTETITLASSLSIPELKSVIQSSIGRAEVSPVENGMLDTPSDFSILVEKKSLVTGVAAVQIHINSDQGQNIVDIVALGQSGFARAMGGMRNTVSLSKSLEFASSIAENIQSIEG